MWVIEALEHLVSHTGNTRFEIKQVFLAMNIEKLYDLYVKFAVNVMGSLSNFGHLKPTVAAAACLPEWSDVNFFPENK